MVAGSAESVKKEVRAALAARPEMFNEFILPHLDGAYNFARYLCRDADAAQDIVQDAYLRAYRGFDGYLGGDPRAWILTIVRNCFLAWSQQTSRRHRHEVSLDTSEADGCDPVEIASEEATPEEMLLQHSEAERVRATINSLPDTLREILVLRELEQLSYRQIADVIDMPIGTVMSRLARARREFAKCWGARDGEGHHE